jgi:ABC-type multidrug transport system fused ATPase/permease subunit
MMVFVPFLGRQFVLYERAVYIAKMTQSAIRRMMREAGQMFLRADIAFILRNNRGKLNSAILNDTRYGTQMITSAADLVTALSGSAAYLLLMVYLNPMLTVVILGSFSLLALIFRRHNKGAAAAGQKLSQSYAGVATAINEALNGFIVVKTRCAVGQAVDRIDNNASHMADAAVEYARVQAFLENVPQPVLMAVSLVVFYVAVAVLHMPLAALAAFAFASTRLVPVASKIGSTMAAITGAYRSCHALMRLRDQATPERLVRDGQRFQGLEHTLEFDHVSFHYEGPEPRPVLEDVSFAIKKGETAAIVGRSGAGKSTLVAILARFYDPVSGQVLLDGKSIDSYQTESFRLRLAFVPQEPVLFDDTVRANVLFGQQRAISDAEIWTYLEKAHCASFVRAMPGGLDALVGERGSHLSGGQRQRLAMARALANEPDILILDEPTSALDGESEQAIQRTLDELRGHLTIILIAHRLATVRGADSIVVLDQGRVMAVGRHRELAADSDAYRALFATQIGADTPALAS